MVVRCVFQRYGFFSKRQRILFHKKRILFRSLQGQASSSGDRLKWIFGDAEWNVDLIGEPFCNAAQQRTATCHPDTVVNDIRVELRRSTPRMVKMAMIINILVFIIVIDLVISRASRV